MHDGLPTTGAEAARLGLKHYFTGKPCSRGHVAKRYTLNNECTECTAERRERMTAERREQYRQYRREKYASDPEYRARVNARNKENSKKYRESRNAKSRARYRDDPEYRRKRDLTRPANQRPYVLRRLYGMTLQDYADMLAKQGGVCAVCGTSDGKTLHVDHCHMTGKIRGLLCSNCNRGLGTFGDDPDRLRKAADYLEKWRGC